MAKAARKINEYNEALENAKPRDYNFSGYGEVIDEDTLHDVNPNPLTYGYEIDEAYQVPDYFANVSAIKGDSEALNSENAATQHPKVVSKKVINKHITHNEEGLHNSTKKVNAHIAQESQLESRPKTDSYDFLKYTNDFEKLVQNLLKQAGKKRRMVNKLVAELNKSNKR